MPQNCAGGTLATYVPDTNKPWNANRVSHLYKRMGFGATYAEIQAALQLTPTQLVTNLINSAKNAPLLPPPTWYNWTINNYTNPDPNVEKIEQYKEFYFSWLNEMLQTGVREKFALFWHNHFVTQFSEYNCPSYLYDYHKLLQQYAFGNFKDFTKAMGKSAAMLFFLDGRLNRKNGPNENYARELFELFTMGVNIGYTQQDITEASKALTGYTNVTVECGAINFNPAQFDNTIKTVFGIQGNFDFDALHDLIFQERAVEVSQFIAAKFYKNFVHDIPNQDIIDGMALTFRNNNFEIEPMLFELFTSDHFFEADAISVQIKSPVECLIMMIKEGNLPYNDLIIEAAGYLTIDMGQQLFQPIDVSGWSGNRTWINSTAITKRWDALSKFLDYALAVLDKEKFRELAIDVSGNSNNVAIVAKKITDHFIPKGLENIAAYNEATISLQAAVPQFYFDSGQWDLTFQYQGYGVPEQVWNLMKWIIRRPEFQLN
jgi:uncharacterized protein (DUF1800 family)